MHIRTYSGGAFAENAYLAAISGYSAVGDYISVRNQFERLSDLGLPDKTRARYAKIATRYNDSQQDRSAAPAFIARTAPLSIASVGLSPKMK